eukprot:SAG31_NODE_5062_length_2765_cov_1.297074_2_plen_83_part_00
MLHSLLAGEVNLLAKAMGAKLSAKELQLAMEEMDEDGSGEVEFNEFYHWWSREDKGRHSGKIAAENDKAVLFTMDIVPFLQG